MKTDRSLPLDRYDPWPLRIVLIGLAFIGVTSILAISFLIANEKDVQGFFTIPVSTITALSMSVSRRPPWSARREG